MPAEKRDFGLSLLPAGKFWFSDLSQAEHRESPP